MSKERRSKPFLSLQQVSRIAKDTLLEQGVHAPLVIADGDRQTIYTHMEQMASTPDERVTQMIVLGHLLAETKEVGILHQAFFITEAWMSTAPSKNFLPRPSQGPQRKEILIISQRIVRPPKTEIALAEMKRSPEGRLIDVEDVALDPQTRDAMTVESPLLDALILGFLGLPPMRGSHA